MVGCSGIQQVRNNKVEQIEEKYYREKADYHCQT